MPRKTIQNTITNEELLKQVNPKNMRLKKDFLQYLHAMQRSEKTCAAYDNDLDIFFVYLLQNCDNKFFVDMTKRDLISFQTYLIDDNKNSPARIRRIKATLSSLSNYICNALDDEFPNYRNIVHAIESPPNTPVREKTVLSDTQCQELLDKLVSGEKYEQACMAALAMFGGRRKSELVRFKVHYFDDENIIFGSLYKTPEPIKTKGRGGNKPLVVYTLAKEFKPYLELWMKERDSKGIESEWLFPDPADPAQHMNADTLNSWAKTFSRLLGVDFYWHCCRHRFTTALSVCGLPDDVIQHILGWSSLELVGVYKDIDPVENLGKYFSDDGIIAPQAKGLSDL
nr:MAG TPA: SITE SPECIFIC RECOMBINASE XERD [Caudoviricetes sp.]